MAFLSPSSLTAWPDTNPGNVYVSATHMYFILDVAANNSLSNERFILMKLLLSSVSLINNGIQSTNKKRTTEKILVNVVKNDLKDKWEIYCYER